MAGNMDQTIDLAHYKLTGIAIMIIETCINQTVASIHAVSMNRTVNFVLPAINNPLSRLKLTYYTPLQH